MPIKAEKKSLPGAPAVRKGRRRDRSREAEQWKEKIAMPKNLVRANRACESPDRFLPRDVASTSRIKLDCQPYLVRKAVRNGSDGRNVTRLRVPEGADKEERANMERWLAKAEEISRNLNR